MMSWKDFDVAPASDNSAKDSFAWEVFEQLDAPGNGMWHLVPSGCQSIQIMLFPIEGSGKIQITMDRVNNVKNGIACFVDWDNGIVDSTTTEAVMPVTAIRQVNVSGTTKLTMRAQ
jgi:hypothetical protein